MTPLFRCVAVTLTIAGLLVAQDEPKKPSSPELDALELQNAILEQQIKLIEQQKKLDGFSEPEKAPDAVVTETERLKKRLDLITAQQDLLKKAVPTIPAGKSGAVETKGDTPFETTQKAVVALNRLAPEIVSELACGNQNLVIHGATHSDQLLFLRAFQDQTAILKRRMEEARNLKLPTPPDAPTSTPPVEPKRSIFGVAALAGPVIESVLNLISLFKTNTTLTSADVTLDEDAAVAAVAAAATGCNVFWPDVVTPNPFKKDSAITTVLEDLSTLNSGPDSLQSKIQLIKEKLAVAEDKLADFDKKIAAEKAKLSDGQEAITATKAKIDWLTKRIKAETDPDRKEKYRKQLETAKDDLDKLEADQLNLEATVPAAVKKLNAEKKTWTTYQSALKDILALTTAASEAYTTFRTSLLDGSSGASALSRLHRAQGLKDLLLEAENSKGSILQLKVQKLSGTQRVRSHTFSNDEIDFSGGVAISFLNYEPGGKVIHAGVKTCRIDFKDSAEAVQPVQPGVNPCKATPKLKPGESPATVSSNRGSN